MKSLQILASTSFIAASLLAISSEGIAKLVEEEISSPQSHELVACGGGGGGGGGNAKKKKEARAAKLKALMELKEEQENQNR